MTKIYDPKGLMKLEFRCPQCGGKMFGTSNATSDDAEGHCNSYDSDGSRCGYRWERSMDEELGVFVKKMKSNARVNLSEAIG